MYPFQGAGFIPLSLSGGIFCSPTQFTAVVFF